jgi:hypothetical protein
MGAPGRIILLLLLLVPVAVISSGAVPCSAAGLKQLDNLEKTLYDGGLKERCARYRAAYAALHQAVAGLNTGEEISSVLRVNRALTQVEQADRLLAESSRELEDLVSYVKANKEGLADGGMQHAVLLAELKDTTYSRYVKSARNLLDAFKDMLLYMKDNMLALSSGRREESARYEVLYQQYVTAVDRYNEVDAARQRFLGEFAARHPELRIYLEDQESKEEKS